jgi:hypothetical protein
MNTNLEKEKTPSSTYPYRTDYTQLSYLDPWGEKYRVVLDYDYNGQIIVDSSAAGGINIPGENVKTGSNNDILYGSSVFVYCPSITAVGLPELTASKVNVLRSEKGKHDFLKSWKNVREPGLQ